MSEPSWSHSWLQFFHSHAQSFEDWLQHPFLGQALWQYAAYLLWIGLGFWLGLRLLDVLEKFFSRIFRQQQEHFSIRLIERLILPMKAALGISFVVGGLRFFHFSKDAARIHDQVLIFAWGVCITLAIVRLTEVFLWRWKLHYKQSHNENLNAQLFTIVEKGSKLFIVLTLAMMTLHNMGVNINSLLASLSIGSLAVALASQDTLANLFGAVSILADNTFKIGDTIRLENTEGKVESIGLRSTRIRDKDGYVVTIPNKNIGTAVITNITQRKNRKAVLQFNMVYQTSVSEMEKACQLLRSIFNEDSSTEDLMVNFRSFDDSWLVIEVVHWYKASTEKDYLASMHRFNLKIKEAFDREGLSFAYPTSTVYIEKNS